MISLFLHSMQSIDIVENPEGGLVNLQVSDQIPYVYRVVLISDGMVLLPGNLDLRHYVMKKKSSF